MSHPYTSINPNLFTQQAGANLRIDLSALARNYRYLSEKVAPAQCAAVVKADAYGLGMKVVAPTLQKEGCKEFFVAHIDEGIALRSMIKPECKIYVLHGLPPDSELQFLQNNLIPILNTIGQLTTWSKLCNDHKTSYPAGIQFDTGMSRFGIGQDELDALQHISWDYFLPTLVMSHLACADNKSHPENQKQLKLFQAVKQLVPAKNASLSASSGIFLGKEWHFNLVRPGVALYGVNPTPDEVNPMHNVITLLGKVIQIRSITAGTSVGYGATFTATKGMKLALISVGYADGFFRCLGNGNITVRSEKMLEFPLAILGRISMDSLCIDITDLPQNTIQIGDSVELIGPHCPIDTVAKAAKTIGYEVLTSLGNRYNRIYC